MIKKHKKSILALTLIFAILIEILPAMAINISIESIQTQEEEMRNELPYNTLFKKYEYSAQQIWDATVKVYKELKMTQYLDGLKQQLVNAGQNLDWGSW